MASIPPADVAYQEAHIDQNRGPVVTGVAIFLIVFTTIVVALRLLTRVTRSMSFWWDDLFAVLGLFFLICACIINIVSVHYGMGKHLIATNPKEGYKILQAGFFLSLDYALAQFCIKSTILFSYVRIFALRIRWFRYAIFGCFFYISGWAIGLIVTILTQCRPLDYFWKQYDFSLNPPAKGHCTINSNATEVSTSALNTAADFVLLFLPLAMVWRLQLNLKRKLAVMAIFAVGAFACIAGVLRLVSTLTVISVTTDSTWDSVGVYQWTAVEASVQLWCACFLFFGPLFGVTMDRIKSMLSSGSGRSLFGLNQSSSGDSNKNQSRDSVEKPKQFTSLDGPTTKNVSKTRYTVQLDEEALSCSNPSAPPHDTLQEK